jgi:hypothetical protein
MAKDLQPRKSSAATPDTSPEQQDHEANRSAPQADRITMPLGDAQELSLRLWAEKMRIGRLLVHAARRV